MKITGLSDVTVDYSRGNGKNGKQYAYVRPAERCSNRSRRVGGNSRQELNDAIIKAVQKYYSPMNYYKINGYVIGSNSEQGALKEFWKICELSHIGKLFNVDPLYKQL